MRKTNENGKLLNGICVTTISIPIYATFVGTSAWCPPHSDYFCKVAEIPCDLTPGLLGANGNFNGQCLLKTDPRCQVGGFLGNDDESCKLLGSQAGCCSNVNRDLATFPMDLIDTSGSESDLRLELSPVKDLPPPHSQSFNHFEGSDLEAKILLNEPDFAHIF